jgi:hypothetical protein
LADAYVEHTGFLGVGAWVPDIFARPQIPG